jgi:hypothetical protein
MLNHVVICVNLLPIGTYLCVLGLFHTIGRPLITTGVRDYLALAVALSGLAITGPIDYILHYRMLPDFLVHSHWIGLGLYLLLVAALLPRSHEKLIIYNSSEASVAAAIRTIVGQLGLPAQELPGGWILPERGVSLELDSFPALRNVTLRFHGMRDRELFRKIHDELVEMLAATRTGWSAAGLCMAAAGGIVLAFPVWILAQDPQNIVAAFREVLETWAQ